MNNSLNSPSKKNSWLKSLSLQQKTLVLFVGAAFVVILLIVLFIANSTRQNTINDAIAQMGTTTDKYADEIKSKMEKDLYIVRTLSGVIQNYKGVPFSQFSPVLIKSYEEALNIDANAISIWDSWELSYLDPTYNKSHGRVRNIVWREGDKIVYKVDSTSLDSDSPEYARMKRDGTECLDEPYFDSYDESENKILMTGVIVPNYFDSKLAGFVGIDVPLTHFHTLIQQIKPYEKSYAFLVSNSFKYIAHPNPDLIGKNAYDQYGEIFKQNGVLDKITNGNPAFFLDDDFYGEESYFTVRPITVGNSKLSWALVMVVPKSTIVQASQSSFIIALLLGLLGVSLIGFFIYIELRKHIIKPIAKVTSSLEKLAKGEIDEESLVNSEDNSDDEIGQMTKYLSKTVDGLTKKVIFSKEIGSGNYDASLDLLSTDDTLGQSLIDMGQGLRTAKEENKKRKAEDDNRQWINEGLAKFSAMLRMDNDNLERLGSNIIKNLVDYLNANQGGLFILNNDTVVEPTFELLASYAYNRQKFINKSILFGEGLVGTCAIEKQTIHLTNIPENYITISSGLGEAKPRSLIIVPLKIEEDVLGVVEIASFNDFDAFQIDFVEKVAQSIAQTLVTVRTTIQTSELLSKTQQQAEEMKAQEEEVRQNLEELETIKEELEKRNDEIVQNQVSLEWEKTLLDSILNFLPDRIYFKDLQSCFIKVSASTLKGFGLDNFADLEGKSDFDFFDSEHARPAYEDEQRIIKTNAPMLGIVEKEVYPDGTVSWAETSKLPLRNSNGEVIGTFGITRDITSKKLMEEEILEEKKKTESIMKDVEAAQKNNEYLFNAICNSSYVIEYTPDGNISYINEAYTKLLGIRADEVIGKHHSYNMDFTDEQRKNYKTFWEDLNNGVVKQETQQFTVNDVKYMFHETYSPIKGSDGKICKIIKIAVNISHLIDKNAL